MSDETPNQQVGRIIERAKQAAAEKRTLRITAAEYRALRLAAPTCLLAQKLLKAIITHGIPLS